MACVVHALNETKGEMKGTRETHGAQHVSKNRNKKELEGRTAMQQSHVSFWWKGK